MSNVKKTANCLEQSGSRPASLKRANKKCEDIQAILEEEFYGPGMAD